MIQPDLHGIANEVYRKALLHRPGVICFIKTKNSDRENYPLYSDQSYQGKPDENGFLIVESSRRFEVQKNYLQPLPTKEVAFYTAGGHTLTRNPNW